MRIATTEIKSTSGMRVIDTWKPSPHFLTTLKIYESLQEVAAKVGEKIDVERLENMSAMQLLTLLCKHNIKFSFLENKVP